MHSHRSPGREWQPFLLKTEPSFPRIEGTSAFTLVLLAFAAAVLATGRGVEGLSQDFHQLPSQHEQPGKFRPAGCVDGSSLCLVPRLSSIPTVCSSAEGHDADVMNIQPT